MQLSDNATYQPGDGSMPLRILGKGSLQGPHLITCGKGICEQEIQVFESLRRNH